ncbi:MAG: hypothetical protein RR831_07135 [Stenotrophomonas sp.]
MSGRPRRSQAELRRAVGEVLHYLWDPIGVADVPDARSEYDAYADRIFAMLVHGSSERDIATALQDIAQQQMGLHGTEPHAARIARTLIAWREAAPGQE